MMIQNGLKKNGACVQVLCKEHIHLVAGRLLSVHNCQMWVTEFGSSVPSCQNRERNMISDGSCWFSNLPVRIFSPHILGGQEENGS